MTTTTLLAALAQHVIDMQDDAYLTGHPEFVALVEEARAALQKEEDL